ncbi:MAG: DUF6067 family protein [Balneolaceae bacterium]|nr:DUF6067 family protein [Balneolaceae bacterium]
MRNKSKSARVVSTHYNRLWIAIFLMLVWTAVPAGPSTAQEIEVWAAPAEQKVRPGDEAETDNLVWSGDESTVSLAGAANEHVPFQVVISTPDPGEFRTAAAEAIRPEALDGFFVEASDLTSSGGDRISSDQIKLYLQHYILLYAESGPVGATGYWPDALVPLREPFDMDAEYSVVRNRPVWIDLSVPSDTDPGIYTGTVTVTQDGNPLKTMDVRLEVYDFALPDRTPLITYMNTSKGWLARFYGQSTDSERIEELTQIYYDFLYDHRMEPWFNDQLEPHVELENGEVSVSFNDSRYRYYMSELNTKRVLLEALPGDLRRQLDAEPFSTEFNRAARAYLSEVASYFREHGWEDRLVFNSPIDEPNSKEEYEATRRWSELVEKAAPNVPFLSTESPVTQNPDWGSLRGHVENFSIHGNALNDPEVKKAIFEEQAKGGEMTWYISCDQGYPQPNYFIDAPAMDPVMVPWITARYKMNGILYWATNFWSDTPNPWRDAVSFNSGFLCSGGYVLNGEGYFFYPGDYAERYTGQPNVKGPISSIRFELLREGIEDYVYLSMLREHGAEEFAEELIRGMVVDVSAFSRNREELHLVRQEMAERLEQLAN